MTMNKTVLSAAVLWVSACNPLPTQVTLKASVNISRSDDQPLAGAPFVVRDDAGAIYDRSNLAQDGSVSALAPAGSFIFAEVQPKGRRPASFTGLSGLDPVYKVADGELYGWPEAEDASWRASFDGCPGVAGGSGSVLGEVRVLDLTDPVSGEHPLAGTGLVELWSFDTEETYLPCLLDGDVGESFDASAIYTGFTGRFAFFGVPEGVYLLSAALELGGSTLEWSDQIVYVPEGGVAPRFPIWVSFPVN